MNPSQAFENLGKTLNIDVSLDADSACTLAFKDVEVHFKGTEEDLYMLASIGSLDGKEYLYKDILEMNYLGMHTRYATLSIEANTLMLHLILPAPIDEKVLEKALILFIENVRYWKEWLESAEEKEEQSASHQDSSLIDNMNMLKI